MKKFELSLTDSYCSGWTLVDAVRELFQNAIDQGVVNPANYMSIDYSDNKLSISSKLAVLNTSSLLLGYTTKGNDTNTIGHFGEGYKIAALVLTRLGKNLTIYNYGNKEKWGCRFVKSRRYDANVLTFFIDSYIFKKVPDSNLTFVVDGISDDEWEDIKQSYIGIMDNTGDKIETEYGNILLGENMVGKIFVNGLFVKDLDDCCFGYDFKPAYIKLERDRRLADSWDLSYYAGKAWTEIYNSNELEEDLKNRIMNAIESDRQDVRLIRLNFSIYYSKDSKIAMDILDNIDRNNETECIPVTTQEEYDTYSTSKYKPVIVNDNIKGIVESSSIYQERVKDATPVVKSTKERLEEWRDRYCHKSRALKELNKILNDMEE